MLSALYKPDSISNESNSISPGIDSVQTYSNIIPIILDKITSLKLIDHVDTNMSSCSAIISTTKNLVSTKDANKLLSKP